ncbi:MAG: hypothetical protein IJV40_13585 [Oscillospiraceae bacterium]|nr:hypothetical protein [Oscillospiraceae bacterium]
MTELEIMQHAKIYLDKLARGIDPLTDREAPEDDVINNVGISRCLFYVSDVLRQVIENGGMIATSAKKGELTPYALPYEERSRYAYSDWPLSASQIAQRLNELVDLETMQKLKTTSITKFLLQSGLLFEEEGASGKKNKRPTEAGRKLGISTQQRAGQNGDYTAVIYDQQAQQFILDNLDAIIAINATPLHENQGKPWEPEEDAWLRQAFQTGVDVKNMSAELKRTRAAVRARLEKLGLTDS